MNTLKPPITSSYFKFGLPPPKMFKLSGTTLISNLRICKSFNSFTDNRILHHNDVVIFSGFKYSNLTISVLYIYIFQKTGKGNPV